MGMGVPPKIICKNLKFDLKLKTSEKILMNHNPFHVGGKKFDELWSTNEKVLEPAY